MNDDEAREAVDRTVRARYPWAFTTETLRRLDDALEEPPPEPAPVIRPPSPDEAALGGRQTHWTDSQGHRVPFAALPDAVLGSVLRELHREGKLTTRWELLLDEAKLRWGDVVGALGEWLDLVGRSCDDCFKTRYVASTAEWRTTGELARLTCATCRTPAPAERPTLAWWLAFFVGLVGLVAGLGSAFEVESREVRSVAPVTSVRAR